MSIQPKTLTTAQRERIAELVGDDLTCIIERDEPHDTHVFVTLYTPDGRHSEEHVINADGRCCDGDCS